MSELSESLVGLVDVVIRPLIEFEDDLEIEGSEADDGSILIEIRVNEDDVGKVIGRQGRIIKAVRTLTRAAASRTSTASVDVEIID